MGEYIPRQDVVQVIRKWSDGYDYVELPTANAIADIQTIPAADVRPVVSGEWEIEAVGIDGEDVYCSVCGNGRNMPDYKFCPWCGARMGGDAEWESTSSTTPE